MAITADTLRWHQSERMTDEDDGGGQMSGVEIVSGVENQIFDDLSDVDRAAGDASLRKVYARVASADADKYLDAGVVVWSPPTDPSVNVLAFSTGSFYDERLALQNKLESGISRGAALQSYLWGDHTTGQRALTLWQRASTKLPVVGQRIEVASGASSQIVWVVGVTASLAERADDKGTYTVRMLVLELAEPLRASYSGIEPTRLDPAAPATKLFDTRYNPGAVSLVGVKPLAEAASLGDFGVKVSGGLFAPLIPTALAETAIPDATPGGGSLSLVAAASGTLAFSTTLDAVGPSKSLYLGSPCYPGSLSIACSGSTITDAGGELMLAGASVGTISYGEGVCTWGDTCPAFGIASKSVSFQPAARPTRVDDTAALAVTVANRGYVWIMTLSPIPAPGTLRVAYRAENSWYEIQDNGAGTLRGADSSYGSGTLNYGTGTVTLTTGAMPDPESEIVFAWSTGVSYTARGGDALDAPIFRGKTAHSGVAPGTFSVAWTLSGAAKLVEDDGSGVLSGTGGSGQIDYATGDWWIRPALIPSPGTELTVDYDYGAPTVESFVGPVRDGFGHIAVTLDHAPRAGSVLAKWPVELNDLADQWAEAEELIPKTTYASFGA